ncbi:MAG TPA: hypothetical protein VLI45_09490, partial [Acidobacteriaceae bacterium]|nr:hypothetical protein [Acidobacteriaceae bacterium]
KMSGERVQVESTGAVPMDVIRDKGVRGAPDVDAFATASDGKAMVMIWNYQDRVREDPAAAANVTVRGLPKGVTRVRIREWRIDETHSNAYTAWKAMGSPAHPTTQQTAKLQAAGQLQQVGIAKSVAAANGEVHLDQTLPGESVTLYEVSW